MYDPTSPVDESAASRTDESTHRKPGPARLASALPGLLLCLLVGALCMFASHYANGLSALLLAIVLGARGATLPQFRRPLKPEQQSPASSYCVWASSCWACSCPAHHIRIGSRSALFSPSLSLVVALSVGVTFLATLWIGKKLGMDLQQRLLIATGFSICGAAAVAGTENVIKAKQEQVATAIGLVVLFEYPDDSADARGGLAARHGRTQYWNAHRRLHPCRAPK